MASSCFYETARSAPAHVALLYPLSEQGVRFPLRPRAELADTRRDPDIAPAAVFLAVFHGFTFRLPSFQQLEAELSQPALQHWIGTGRAFRDDVLRYSLSSFHLNGLDQMLVQVNRTLKRNQAFDTGPRARAHRGGARRRRSARQL